jgi:hypothetical protein
MKKTTQEKMSTISKKAILPFAFMLTAFLSYAGETRPVPNAIMVTRNLNNKRHKVRLFTASDNKTLLFTVDGVEGNHYTLFVFDLDGRLIMQSVIRNRETGILPEINTGAYLYEVLAGDNKVENGQLKVK